jgi:peptidyl-Lys metalloendopeptidase
MFSKATSLTIASFALAMSLSTPALADFRQCSPAQQSDIEKARYNAFDALSAATVQITPQNGAYSTWFGRWDAVRAKFVRRTVSALKNHIRTSKITYVCERQGAGSCDGNTYAYVYPRDSSTIHLCGPYFNLPTLSDATFLEVFNSGTRAGTIIHEMSHYEDVGSTNDNCYNRDACSSFARTSPNRAAHNADSFQYFAEDAYLKAR